jgi:hypothetical protein
VEGSILSIAPQSGQAISKVELEWDLAILLYKARVYRMRAGSGEPGSWERRLRLLAQSRLFDCVWLAENDIPALKRSS